MGGKHSTTTSKVTIPPEVLERYNAVNKRAETAAATPYQAFGKTAADYVAQMNAQQNAGISDINATAGSYLPYMDKATAATTAGMGPAYAGIDNYMSPYIKNVADTTGAYLRQQQEQAQSGALGNAISSGAFGGDRAGIAAANLQQQNQMGYGKTMADIMNQGYTQALGASQADLARQLQGGAQMAGLGAQSQQLGLQGAQAKIAAGTMQQQTEQAGKDAMINQFMQEKGYPFQVAQFLSNIAMGTGAASGSTTTTQTPRNWLGFASGGVVEGYADGGGVSGPRTYSQLGIGGTGYVPAGDLPVGQLMVANPPDQQQSNGTDEIIKLITKAMGAARGGAIDQRHGYALDGRIIGLPFSTPVTDELRERLRLQPKAEGYDPSFDYRKQQNNIDASMAQDRANPSNMGLAGHMYPKALMPGNDIPPLTPRTTPLPVGPEEQWDVPVRSGMTKPEQPFRSGMQQPAISFRNGMREPEMPFRSGMEKPEIPFRSGLVPFESSPAMGGPGTFAAGSMPSQLASMRPQRRPEGLGYQPTMPEGGPTTMPAGLLPASLAPVTSPFPPKRPAGLAGADVADAAMETLGTTASPETSVDPVSGLKTIQIEPTAYDVPSAQPATLGSEVTPSKGAMVDTGVATTGGYNPIISTKKQLDFVTYELQKPEYKGYLENIYATPAQAAVAFEQIYERAKGANNDVAAANATDIYNAARNGKLNDLPPNVVEAYNHFIQNGMDPIQASGAVGRLMVESYSHLDPNARNTLGGGNGTYGIAQWRGPRMEELAEFAGVPLETLANAPVSTPEGRYYSHNADFSGGVGGADITAASGDGLGGADVTRQRGDPLHINKPYEDRNLIGKFFHDPTTGKLNPIAIKALISGLSGAAQAQTISPLGGILAGFGAGNATYNTLQNEEPKRVADIMANSKNARIQYLTEVAMGEERPFEQWAVSKYGSGPASMFGSPEGGAAVSQPTGKVDIMGSGLSQQITLPNGVVVQGGQNYAFLTKLANDLQPYVAAGVPAAINTAATVESRLTDIRDSKGFVQDINGNQVQDPTYTETLNEAARVDFGRTKTLEFQAAANERKQQLDQDLSEIKNQEDVFTKFPAGALAKDKAAAFAIFGSLGVPVPANTEDYAAAAQEAVKNAARKVLMQVGTTAPSQEMQRLAVIVEDPNMQPEAIKMILSLQKAQASRQLAYYTLRSEWDAANPTKAMDQTAYDTWFAENHKFANYYEDAKKSMPIFAGELGSKQKPYKLSPEKDADGNYSQADADYNNLPIGSFFVDPNGLVKQKSGG